MKEFSEEQYAEYKETFNLFDKNGDGIINAADFERVMESFGIPSTLPELKQMMEELGTSGKDSIDFNEFVTLMSNHSLDSDKELQEAFKIFDKNGDGRLSAEDLKEVMKMFGEKSTDKEVAEIIKLFDFDGDGQINYSDFVKMMKNK